MSSNSLIPGVVKQLALVAFHDWMAVMAVLLSGGVGVPKVVLLTLCTCEDCPLVCGYSNGLQGLLLCATMSLHLLACPAPLLRVSYFFLMRAHQFGPSTAFSQDARAVQPLSTLGSCVPLSDLCHSSCFRHLTSAQHSAAAWISCCISSFLQL